MVPFNLKKPAFSSPALSLELPLSMMPPEGFDPGSDNTDGGSGDDVDASDSSRRRKRYHRHTPQQIQELESLFKECPHPDEKRRLELSRRLNLETRQVKFWFQNRRTQMKTQLERHENSLLRQENDKLRAENMSIRDAMRNPICSNCGGPAIIGDISVEQQHLKIENGRLKEELDRVCAIANKFLGRSISLPSSSLELGFGSTEPTQTDKSLERSMLLELALVAMDELVKLAQPTEPVWVKTGGSMEILNRDDYLRRFIPCIGVRPAGLISEASRETIVVIVNTSSLVEILMDANRWAEMFPSIIGRASTTEVISSGMGGTRNGSLQLMEAELQILSPLVPIRKISFLRFCKQQAENVWAVVDVSIDGIRDVSGSNCRRLPSGCVIEDNPDGYSKVTWVEHAEYNESQIHQLYRPFVASGMGFGAQRWLATLQRQLERLAILASPPVDVKGLSGGGRRSMVKLAERMRESFCGGVCASSVHKWNKLNAGSLGEDVRVMTRSSVDNPGEPPGIILSAATSVWFPVSPLRLFDFLQDHQLRSQWDILSNGGPMKEIVNISVGQAQSNSASLLRASAVDTNKSSMLILQETCVDSSGFLVVYAPVDIPAIQLVMNGGDSAYVALLPSGFSIVSDGRGSARGDGGSLLTVAFQILVNSLPTAKLTVESVETVNNLLSCTVQKIKAALNCD